MAANTQIGKIQIPYKVHNKEGHIPSDNFKFNRSREFSEDYTSKDWLEFASRWLHLASYSGLLDDIDEYLNTQIILTRKYKNGLVNAVTRYDPNREIVYLEDCVNKDNPSRHIVYRIQDKPDKKEE